MSCESNTEYYKFNEETRFCELKKCHNDCYDNSKICDGLNEESCISCPSGKVYYDKKCVDKCPEGFFKTNSDCEPCKGKGDENCI